MKQNIDISQQELDKLCRKHSIRRLALFGSVLTPDFNNDSDIDVLVEFEEGVSIGLFRFVGIQRELSAICGGRNIDLHTPNELSRYFRDQVLSTMQVRYAG
jgi:uncharacterized protein